MIDKAGILQDFERNRFDAHEMRLAPITSSSSRLHAKRSLHASNHSQHFARAEYRPDIFGSRVPGGNVLAVPSCHAASALGPWQIQPCSSIALSTIRVP
jgi:hypothetical protein